MKEGKLFLIIIACLIFFCFPLLVKAFELPKIIINEVCWAGSSKSTADEWIELKNISTDTINIKGWEISSAASSGKSFYIPTDKDYFLPPGQFFLIANYNKDDSHSVLDIDPDIINTSISLLNSNNGNLILKNNQGEIIDQAKGDSWPAGDNEIKASMERIGASDGLLASNWQTATKQINIIFGVNDLGTPKAENSPSIFSPPDDFSEEIKNNINLDNAQQVKAQVIRIIDGDTIEVVFAGITQKIRLIGIDSPESAQSSSFNINEPYYQEAKDYATANLLNKEITLLVANTSDDRIDNYQRLLAIVILGNNIFNVQMLDKGYAKNYYLDNSLIIKNNWQIHEETAKKNRLGLWENFGNQCVLVNELMPNPAGDDSQNEWIELINNCNYEINLKNWFLDDEEGGSDPYLISHDQIIKPGNFWVVSIRETKIGLNNDGDSIRLFTPDLNLADQVTYTDSAKENYSYARFGNEFKWSIFPTSNAPNQLLDSNEQNNSVQYQKIEKIADLTNISKDAKVQIEGIVSVEPGVLGKQYFYLQDESAGTQIYNFNSDFGQIIRGQKLQIFGQLSDTKYLRVKINNGSDIKFLSEANIIIPKELEIKEIDKKYEGLLIKTKGLVSDLSKNVFYLNNNNFNIKVYLKNSQFKPPNITNGAEVELLGIVYSNGDKLEILPRGISDINISNQNIGGYEIGTKVGTIVKVTGVVNSTSNIFGERYLYIQNEDHAWQIYCSKKCLANLKIGDKIEIIGKISSVKNRILIYTAENINFISTENLYPIEIDNQNLANLSGYLVTIYGQIISKKGNKLFISSGGQNYIIYFKTNTNIKPGIFKVNDVINIIGIVEKYKDEYRIIPRNINDINYYSIQSIDKANSKVKTGLIQKAYATNSSFPKENKYLVKASERKYNSTAIYNLILSLVISVATLIIGLISCHNAKRLFNQK